MNINVRLPARTFRPFDMLALTCTW